MTVDIDKLKALEAAATPGEWRQGSIELHHVLVLNTRPDALGTERVLLRMNDRGPWSESFAADAEFIAAARTAIPELIAELARMRPVFEAAKAWRTNELAIDAHCIVGTEVPTLNRQQDWQTLDALRDVVDTALAAEAKESK